MMRNVVIISLLVSMVYSESCVTKLSQVVLNPSTEETRLWGLRDVFFSGQNLTFSLSNSSDFYIQDTILAAGPAGTYIGGNPSIINVVPRQSRLNNKAWTNSFAMLSQEKGAVNVFWATGYSEDSRISPDFNVVTYIYPSSPTINSLNLNYLDELTVIIDSFDTVTFKNYFYLANKFYNFQTFEVQNIIGYTTVTRRISKIHLYPSIGGNTTTYLFRGVPALAGDKKFRGISTIEVFSFDYQKKPSFTGNFLDAATLATISNDKSATFSFNLVDFQITSYGLIYILDSSMKLFRVLYQADGQWIFKGLIENKNARALAFDVNTQDQTGITRVAILFFDYFIIYEWPENSPAYTSKILFELDFKITGDVGTFKFSNTFLQIQDPDSNNLYTYDLATNQLYNQINLGGPTTVLVNPYYDIAITLTSTQTQAWSFTQGLLGLKAPKTEQATRSIILSATAPDSTECEATISYRVFDRTNWNIFSVNPLQVLKPLPPMVTYPSQSEYSLAGLGTGPNLNYNVDATKKQTFLAVQDDISVLSVYKLWQLNVTNQTYPIATDVIFSDTISRQNTLVYTQAIQTKDLMLTIWECEISSKTSEQSVCESLGTIQTAKKLTGEQFNQFAFFDQILVAYQDTAFSISLNSCDDGACEQYGKIKYSQQRGNEITSFIVQQEYIWVLRATSRTIDIYSAFGDNELVYTITSTQLAGQGFTGTFTPTQLFANRVLNKLLVFVNNQFGLFVLSYPNELNFVKFIPYTLSAPLVHVAVASETFFLSQLDGTNSFLSEYNFADLTNIILQKNHYLYWYAFQRPLQANVCQENGYLYIRALCTKCQKTFVLAYAPNIQQRDALYEAVNTGVLIEDGKSLVMSVGGNTDMYVYINTGEAHSNNKLLRDPILVTSPKLTTNELFETVSMNLQVNNFDFEGKTNLLYNSDVTIFNTQTIITIDQDAFNKYTNGLFSFKGVDDEQTIDLTAKWYQGQVLRFDVECTDCNTNIKVRNYVEESQLSFSYSEASGFAPWKENLLVQTPKNIYFTKKNEFSQTYVTLEQPNDQFTCSLVTSSEDGLFIVSICSDSIQVYAYITSCISDSECFPIEYIVLAGVTKVAKVDLIGTTLFILDSDWQNPLAFEGSLKVFSLVIDNDNWSATKIYDMNSDFFKQSPTDVSKVFITDFDILRVDSSKRSSYTVYLAAATRGIYAVEIIFVRTQISRVYRYLSTELYTFLANNQQYTSQDTQFLSVSIYSSAVKDNILTQQLFVTTSNVAHYAMTFTYTINDQDFLYDTASINFIVNRYGAFPTLNRVKVSKTTITIPYGNALNNQVIFAVYDIPKLSLKAGSPPVILMKGGSQAQLSSQQYNNLALAYQVNDENSLVTNGANSFTINSKLQIVVMNGSKVQNQKIQLIAQNDFSKDQFETNIVRNNSNDDKSGSGSWKWWYTLFIVIGVVLIFGAVGVFVVKNKNQKNVMDSENNTNTLLGSQDPSAGQVQQGNNNNNN